VPLSFFCSNLLLAFQKQLLAAQSESLVEKPIVLADD
jgi:hypothetical protein